MEHKKLQMGFCCGTEGVYDFDYLYMILIMWSLSFLWLIFLILCCSETVKFMVVHWF